MRPASPLPWLFYGPVHLFDACDRRRYKAAFRLAGHRYAYRFSRRTFRTAREARAYGERVGARMERVRLAVAQESVYAA